MLMVKRERETGKEEKKRKKYTILKNKKRKEHYAPAPRGKTESQNQIKTEYFFISAGSSRSIGHFKEGFFIIGEFIQQSWFSWSGQFRLVARRKPWERGGNPQQQSSNAFCTDRGPGGCSKYPTNVLPKIGTLSLAYLIYLVSEFQPFIIPEEMEL